MHGDWQFQRCVSTIGLKLNLTRTENHIVGLLLILYDFAFGLYTKSFQ